MNISGGFIVPVLFLGDFVRIFLLGFILFSFRSEYVPEKCEMSDLCDNHQNEYLV